jgi:hypothetical protein
MEILRNFKPFQGQEKPLDSLADPHFYAWFPAFPGEYRENFLAGPIDTFQQHARIHVLTDVLGPLGRVVR